MSFRTWALNLKHETVIFPVLRKLAMENLERLYNSKIVEPGISKIAKLKEKKMTFV